MAQESSIRLMRRLLRDYVRPHWGTIAMAVVFMVIVALTTAATAALMQPAIDRLFIGQEAEMLYRLPLAIILIVAAKGVATYLQAVLMHGVGQRIIADTQIGMYGHLMRADLAWLSTVHSGKLISSFLYDANLLRDAVGRAITGIAKDTVMAAALIGVMFWMDWQLALVVLIAFPAAGIFIRKLGKRMRKASTATQEETGRLSQHLTETLKGVRTVQAYGAETAETGRAAVLVENRLKQIMRMIRTRSAATPFTEAMGGVAVALAIFYGGWRAQSGDLTLGAFMAFQTALLMAYQPMKSLASLNQALQEGLAAAQRLFAVLDVEPTVVDRPDATPLAVEKGGIRFENVSFAYGDDVPAVRDIDIAVPPGAVVALVGASGAGKSTLLNLIPRFHDVSAGRLSIDGQDVREVTLASLRAALALVSQETVLFDDSVRANIAYGRPDADEAAIEAAARAAAAHDFILDLPQGYDTRVGENGVRLSGGQRQRLAIARAMLRDAPILLLDEATSALDSESEAQVQAALATLMRGRTTLVIAHRLSTVQNADRIYVLDGGRVVEDGTHDSLLARGGAYARLHAMQFADTGTQASADPAETDRPEGAVEQDPAPVPAAAGLKP